MVSIRTDISFIFSTVSKCFVSVSFWKTCHWSRDVNISLILSSCFSRTPLISSASLSPSRSLVLILSTFDLVSSLIWDWSCKLFSISFSWEINASSFSELFLIFGIAFPMLSSRFWTSEPILSILFLSTSRYFIMSSSLVSRALIWLVKTATLDTIVLISSLWFSMNLDWDFRSSEFLVTACSMSFNFPSESSFITLNLLSKLSIMFFVVSGPSFSKADIFSSFCLFWFCIKIILWSNVWLSWSLSVFSFTSRSWIASPNSFLMSSIALVLAWVLASRALFDSSDDFCLSDSTFLTCSVCMFTISWMFTKPWELFIISISILSTLDFISSDLLFIPKYFWSTSDSRLSNFSNNCWFPLSMSVNLTKAELWFDFISSIICLTALFSEITFFSSSLFLFSSSSHLLLISNLNDENCDSFSLPILFIIESNCSSVLSRLPHLSLMSFSRLINFWSKDWLPLSSSLILLFEASCPFSRCSIFNLISSKSLALFSVIFFSWVTICSLMVSIRTDISFIFSTVSKCFVSVSFWKTCHWSRDVNISLILSSCFSRTPLISSASLSPSRSLVLILSTFDLVSSLIWDWSCKLFSISFSWEINASSFSELFLIFGIAFPMLSSRFWTSEPILSILFLSTSRYFIMSSSLVSRALIWLVKTATLDTIVLISSLWFSMNLDWDFRSSEFLVTACSMSFNFPSESSFITLNLLSNSSIMFFVVSGPSFSKAVIFSSFCLFWFCIKIILWSNVWLSWSLSVFSLTSRSWIVSTNSVLMSSRALALAWEIASRALFESSDDFCLSDSIFFTCSNCIFTISWMLTKPCELFILSLSILSTLDFRSSDLLFSPTYFCSTSNSTFNSFSKSCSFPLFISENFRRSSSWLAIHFCCSCFILSTFSSVFRTNFSVSELTLSIFPIDFFNNDISSLKLLDSRSTVSK